MSSSPLRWPLLAAAVVLLGGCAATTTSLLPGSAGSQPDARHVKTTGKALIVITVPSAAATVRLRVYKHGRPAYVSTATKGMTIAFESNGQVVASKTVALTPGAKGCSTSAAGTTCQTTVRLAACTGGTNCYFANVSTYDAVSCTGTPQTCSIPPGANELSTEQQYPVGIFVGTTTTLALTLAGIPASTVVSPADLLTRANATGGFDLIGLGAHALSVRFLDADGAFIVGAGSPSIAVSPVSGSLTPVTVATPPASPNEVYVTPPTTFNGTDSATFTVAPSYAGQATNGCGAPNANCTPTTIAVDMVQMLAIAGNSLQLYAFGANTPLATYAGAGSIGLAADAAGNLYTGRPDYTTNDMVAFSPPFTTGLSPTTLVLQLTALVQSPKQSAYISGDVNGYTTAFCQNLRCSGGYGIDTVFQNNSLATDAAGDTAYGGPVNQISVNGCKIWLDGVGPGAPSITGDPNGPECAQQMAMDASGNLFYTVPNAYEVVEASKASAYATKTVISTGSAIPYRLAVDASGNLVCAGQDILTLAATLQATAASTLSAHQGGSIVPDQSVVLGGAPVGQGTSLEAMTTTGNTLYIQYAFLGANSGTLATYTLPNLALVGTPIQNEAVGPTGLAIVP